GAGSSSWQAIDTGASSCRALSHFAREIIWAASKPTQQRSDMPVVHLNERALVEVAGPDAEHFLQNVLTPDLTAVRAGEAHPGALLTPQGKILFAFLITRQDEAAFLLEVPAADADGFVKRLLLYRLRAKAEISVRDQRVVAVSWQNDST